MHYPNRGSHFAHKYCRLLFKQCVANEIGPEGCWLLAVIAHTEDARHYKGAVTFFNLQLAPLVGLGSADALDRVRKKCVAAGWLHYEPGAKGVAGRYWVTVPEQAADLGDGPTDESQNECEGAITADTAAISRTNPRSKCGRNREESAEHSSLSLSPSLFADVPPATPAPTREPKTTPKEKKTRPRNPLFDALVEVTGSDPVVNGKYVGRVAALFASADPPYTPDEVHDFARDWRLLLPWAKQAEHPRLTLGIVEKYLPQLRAAKLLSRPSQEFRPPPDFDTQPQVLAP